MGYEKLNSNVMTVGCQGGGKKRGKGVGRHPVFKINNRFDFSNPSNR